MQIFNSSSRLPPNGAVANPARREPKGLHYLLTGIQTEGNGSAGSVIAFTSVNPGEGVSHVVQTLARKVALQTGRRTALIDAAALRKLRVADFIETPGRFLQTDVPNLWLLSDEKLIANELVPQDTESPTEDEELGFDPLHALAYNFNYTFIDCPSLGASYEAEMLASDVNGVVLVIEADVTRREQILRAKRTIEMANGKVMAMILNKRRHVVPGWLYRMF